MDISINNAAPVAPASAASVPAHTVLSHAANRVLGPESTSQWIDKSRSDMGGDHSNESCFSRVDAEAKTRLTDPGLSKGEQASIHLVDSSALIKRTMVKGGALKDQTDADASFAEVQKAKELAPHQHDVVQQHSRMVLSIADKGFFKRNIIEHHLGVSTSDMAAKDIPDLLAPKTGPGEKVDALDILMAQRLSKFSGDKKSYEAASQILAGLPKSEVDQALQRLNSDAKSAQTGDSK